MTTPNSGTARHSEIKRHALQVWDQAIQEVAADKLIRNAVTVDEHALHLRSTTGHQQQIRLDGVQRICIAGAGKAAAAMTEGLLSVLGLQKPGLDVELCGQINGMEGQSLPDLRITFSKVRDPGCNLPTELAVRQTRRMKRLVAKMGAGDLCLWLISGGGSAMLCEPAAGVTLQDKLTITQSMQQQGASIRQLNTVRKCLSAVKSGGLADSCNAEQQVTLLLSDVMGPDLSTISSGPTIVECKPFTQAIRLTEQFGQSTAAAERILKFLRAQQKLPQRTFAPASDAAQNSFQPAPCLIGNNQSVVQAAARQVESLGYRVIELASLPEESVDETVERLLAQLELVLNEYPCRPFGIISGGEPTLKLVEPEIRGRGGRNQQLLLQLVMQLGQLDSLLSRSFCFLSGGTDGEDGVTNTAGAICDHADLQNSFSPPEVAKTAVSQNDSHTFWSDRGCTLPWYPTRTNVCDLRLLLVGPSLPVGPGQGS